MSISDTITLDGPAGSGKSTVARLLSKELNRRQVDSGAMYRTITYMALVWAKVNNGNADPAKINLESICTDPDFIQSVKDNPPDIVFESEKQNIFWNSEDMENHIRNAALTDKIKYIADRPELRKIVNQWIRELAQKYPVIADGRDMGTVVFPEAKNKFFLDASLDVRAKRRLKEFQEKEPGISFEEVREKIALRDAQDEAREFGGLKPAQDVIFVDTTNREINAVVQFIITKIR